MREYDDKREPVDQYVQHLRTQTIPHAKKNNRVRAVSAGAHEHPPNLLVRECTISDCFVSCLTYSAASVCCALPEFVPWLSRQKAAGLLHFVIPDAHTYLVHPKSCSRCCSISPFLCCRWAGFEKLSASRLAHLCLLRISEQNQNQFGSVPFRVPFVPQVGKARHEGMHIHTSEAAAS